MKTIKVGAIGLGLMGREFGSAAARWCHLTDIDVKPEIVAICDTNPDLFDWWTGNFDTINQVTSDYHELLANDEVDVVYVAVPHSLHEQFYCDIIKAGKHMLGEKPFGIDKAANDTIMACLKDNPDVFVRCTSHFPFFPVMQRIGRMIEEQAFGRIIEVNSGFLHSSDLNPDKPINWKRMIDINGEYGCLGDLGMHPCHMPFKAGWYPKSVRAILSNLMPQRPDKSGKLVPCETWENGTMFCDAVDHTGEVFPLTIKTQRIAPGETDTWYFEVKGMKACARWSSKNARLLELLEYTGGKDQAWQQIDMGWESTYAAITGGIFEFGFCDALQQMWAAYLTELVHGEAKSTFAGCVTPEEVAYSHRLFTAALKSHAEGTTEQV